MSIKSATIDASAGDSYVDYWAGYPNPINRWLLYADASDSDKFKIASTNSGSPVDVLTIDSNGYVNQPKTQCASGRIESASNKTGDSTAFTLTYSDIFDQSANLGPSMFTAPVTGKYLFNINTPNYGCTLTTGATTVVLKIVTSNRIYTVWNSPTLNTVTNFYNGTYAGRYELSACGSIVADLDISDDAYCTITGYDGAKVDSVRGVAEGFFSVKLLA